MTKLGKLDKEWMESLCHADTVLGGGDRILPWSSGTGSPQMRPRAQKQNWVTQGQPGSSLCLSFPPQPSFPTITECKTRPRLLGD